MNLFNFESQLKRENDNRVNLIYTDGDGIYTHKVLNGREELNNMDFTGFKWFYSISEVMESDLFKKFKNTTTILIERVGTDCSNWIISYPKNIN